MQSRTRRPQFFYTTTPLPCPYLPGRTERKIVTELTGPDAEALHDRLSRAGFRRSHNIAYSPVCPGCRACVPIRVRAADFMPNRTQRKIIARNADLEVRPVPARATAEQFALFQHYQQTRHPGGDMAAMGFYDYRAMVEDTPITTGLVEFRDGTGRLLGACLTDWLSDGLSAVYSFFAPEEDRRSLGAYAVMWLLGEAVRGGQPYVYLGYWVAESRKMAYKAGYRPAEVLVQGQWTPLGEDAPVSGESVIAG
ncbi:arginyltransferase [Sediminicoccus sp. BL-A-41-H5]|uniref:arginyltransferase n=1 Tax=Sediminicoccus sp. BL-A-41-H5 TaxID=3421106 RepID=UPI003D676953